MRNSNVKLGESNQKPISKGGESLSMRELCMLLAEELEECKKLSRCQKSSKEAESNKEDPAIRDVCMALADLLEFWNEDSQAWIFERGKTNG